MGPALVPSFIVKYPRVPASSGLPRGQGTQVSRWTNNDVVLSSSWAEGSPQTNTAAEGWWGPHWDAPGPEREPRTGRGMQAGGSASRPCRFAPAPQTRVTVWAEAEHPKPTSPDSQGQGAGRWGSRSLSAWVWTRGGLRTHGVHVSLSASSPPPPLRTPAPPDQDHPNDAIRPEPPTEDSYFQIRSV